MSADDTIAEQFWDDTTHILREHDLLDHPDSESIHSYLNNQMMNLLGQIPSIIQAQNWYAIQQLKEGKSLEQAVKRTIPEFDI